MNKYSVHTFSALILGGFLALAFFAGHHVVLAVDYNSLDNYGLGKLQAQNSKTGLGTADPIDIVFSIIRFVLGLLGLIAVCLILYAGFIWMTSAGNQEKIKKAKGIMSAGVVGLIIVFLAVSITTFVINRIKDTTGATGN